MQPTTMYRDIATHEHGMWFERNWVCRLYDDDGYLFVERQQAKSLCTAPAWILGRGLWKWLQIYLPGHLDRLRTHSPNSYIGQEIRRLGARLLPTGITLAPENASIITVKKLCEIVCILITQTTESVGSNYDRIWIYWKERDA